MKKKVTGVTKLLKSRQKQKFFYGYCKHEQKKCIISYKTSG